MPETTAPAASTMSTTGPANVTSPNPAPPAPHETIGQRVGDFFHRADQDAAALIAKAPGIEADIRDHAGTVFTVAAEVLALAKIADPALAPALAPVSLALAALEPKILALVQSAAVITGQLSSTSKPS